MRYRRAYYIPKEWQRWDPVQWELLVYEDFDPQEPPWGLMVHEDFEDDQPAIEQLVYEPFTHADNLLVRVYKQKIGIDPNPIEAVGVSIDIRSATVVVHNNFPSPSSFNIWEGAPNNSHSWDVNISASFVDGVTTYTFKRWEDGSATRPRPFTPAAGLQTMLAYYENP
jgi:hypothetical protein